MSTKDEYVRKMHSKLDRWSTEIDALDARADKIKAEARVEYHKQLESLRSKRDEARKHLEALQQAGEGAWSDMRAGIEMAWDAIGEALESARSRFK